MLRKSREGIEWLEFEQLQGISGLVHGVFLRKGGCSQEPYASLNMGGGTGDTPQNIEQNRERIRQILSIPRLTSGYQVHGSHVAYVPFTGSEECDGMITQEKGLGLMIKHADCQAAIFYDPMQKMLANVHAGWRGNVKNIYAETIKKMQAKGSRVENLLICISPSLGPDHAEFINFREELPASFWEFQIRATYFDLWAISRHQLLNQGVLPHHIEIASLCTYQNAEDFTRPSDMDLKL